LELTVLPDVHVVNVNAIKLKDVTPALKVHGLNMINDNVINDSILLADADG
jgi:hypothetical protein